MWLVVVAHVLVLQGGQNARPVPPPQPAHAIALRDSLEAAELRFMHDWNLVWRASEGARHEIQSTEFDLRTRNLQLHCHPPENGGVRPMGTLPGSMIKSRDSWFAVCPSWSLDAVVPLDERLGIDFALDTAYQRAARMARASLIAMFENAAVLLPRDDWLAGQRVRLLVDQREFDRALSVAASCQAKAWWCAALLGYTHSARQEVVPAESAFAAMNAALLAAERCRWNDLTELVDSAGRSAYARLSCAQREVVNARLWWLADPLYIEPGNERRVEQYARTVLRMLHGALDHDERYDWRADAGGDALELAIVRYGWPGYTWWGGEVNERSHSGYLAEHSTALNETYTSFEYPRTALHTFALMSAVNDPLHARASDWSLSSPASTPGPEQWPRELFSSHAPIAQLPDGQVAMLRREDHVHVAIASELPSYFGGDRPAIHATLLATEAPDAVRVVGGGVGSTLDAPLVVRGDIPSRQTLIAVEFPAAGPRAPAGRTRFSVAPPPTLAALKPGEFAVSDPVVLLAPLEGDTLPNGIDGALARMAGSTRVAFGRLGVYWETYGLQPADSVEIAVWIERYTAQGIARRLGIALNVAADYNTPVAMSWREPEPGHVSAVIAGRVTIISRSLELDVSKLPKGDYWLDVAVARPGAAPARGRRGFTLQ